MWRSRRFCLGPPNSASEDLVPRHQFPRDNAHFLSKGARMFRPSAFALTLLLSASAVHGGGSIPAPTLSTRVIISIRDQKLMLMQNGNPIATYAVPTSKYGLGDSLGSLATPLGLLQVAQKIGDHAPIGAVFHNRRWTGEVLHPNTPGRDPVMTRIIWLRGLEMENAHAFSRCIYIHGTNEEKLLGRPASFGCIRMRSVDVAALYGQLPLGTPVEILNDKLPKSSNLADPEVYGFDTPASGSGPRKDKDKSQIKVAAGSRAAT